MINNIQDYISYFQQLANEHVEINDFYIMDINEPLMAMRGEMQYPALILNALAGNLLSRNLDCTLDQVKGGFLIVGHLAQLDDFTGEMELLRQMKAIGGEIIARMVHDVYKCELRAVKAIPGFDINTVQYQMIDGIFENGFGFLFNFTITSLMDLEYDATRWNKTEVVSDIYPDRTRGPLPHH
jgi:hypothetical protein